MEPPSIPYDHPDRLRAIVDTYFGFLKKEAGFTEAESHYSRPGLTGQLSLRRPEVEVDIGIRNDDVDLYVRPSGAQADSTKVVDLVFYFKRPPLDYAPAQERPPDLRSQDEVWRSEAASVKRYLDDILAFAQEPGYEERVADLKRYQAEGVAELRRQMAEYRRRRP
jgi:hypothetical protein